MEHKPAQPLLVGPEELSTFLVEAEELISNIEQAALSLGGKEAPACIPKATPKLTADAVLARSSSSA